MVKYIEAVTFGGQRYANLRCLPCSLALSTSCIASEGGSFWCLTSMFMCQCFSRILFLSAVSLSVCVLSPDSQRIGSQCFAEMCVSNQGSLKINPFYKWNAIWKHVWLNEYTLRFLGFSAETVCIWTTEMVVSITAVYQKSYSSIPNFPYIFNMILDLFLFLFFFEYGASDDHDTVNIQSVSILFLLNGLVHRLPYFMLKITILFWHSALKLVTAVSFQLEKIFIDFLLY